MGLKQLLIVFQKFVQNIHSREQRLIDGKKDARKLIFTPLEKEEDQILRTMTCCKKIKDVIIGSRLARTVISRKMVVAIGTGVVKANNEPKILREFELTELTELKAGLETF